MQHRARTLRQLFTTVTALGLAAACQQDVTAPRPSSTARVAPGHTAIRRATYVDGLTITMTGDDGNAVTIDYINHTLTVNGISIIVTQEAADSLYNMFDRMNTAEQQALYVRSAGTAGGGINNPPPPNPNCDQFAIYCGSSSFAVKSGNTGPEGQRQGVVTHRPYTRPFAGSEALRPAAAGRPFVAGPVRVAVANVPRGDAAVGATTLSGSEAGTMTVGAGAWAQYSMGYDPTFTCTDISLAIMNEMPNYYAAKTAVLAAISAQAVNVLSMTKGVPPNISEPSSWLGWGKLYTAGPSLDLAYANLEAVRLRLGSYAVMFNAQNCLYDNTKPRQSGTDNGSSGGGPLACYVRIYFYLDTGEIFDQEYLGCW